MLILSFVSFDGSAVWMLSNERLHNCMYKELRTDDRDPRQRISSSSTRKGRRASRTEAGGAGRASLDHNALSLLLLLARPPLFVHYGPSRTTPSTALTDPSTTYPTRSFVTEVFYHPHAPPSLDLGACLHDAFSLELSPALTLLAAELFLGVLGLTTSPQSLTPTSSSLLSSRRVHLFVLIVCAFSGSVHSSPRHSHPLRHLRHPSLVVGASHVLLPLFSAHIPVMDSIPRSLWCSRF